MAELYVILSFMVVASVVAVETKDLLSAVIALGAVGFGVTLSFLLLQAPDLAIVQIVVEILSLVFLIAVIRKTTREDTTQAQFAPRDVFPVIMTVGAVGLFLVFGILALQEIPAFGSPLLRVAGRYVRDGLALTGAGNLVAAVILDFRGYDTLGEATVLFTSVIAVLSVLRKVGRKS
jgi:multisubunit Na+/H+ antiporter MnhB subunit